MTTNSVISLDLGGKYTGFFSYSSRDLKQVKDFQSGTITYNENFGLSQAERRKKRHTKRNILRRKLSKRLFLLILNEHYKCNIDFLPDEILSLFNKRGYIYASLEITEEDDDLLSCDFLRGYLNDKISNYPINDDLSIEDFLNQIASNNDYFDDYLKKFNDLFNNVTSVSDIDNKLQLADEIKGEFENKNDETDFFKGIKLIKKILDSFEDEKKQGNLPRAKYFEEINKEIDNSDKIQEFLNKYSFDSTCVKNLIGNISNFQLKELRRYFNDKEMINGDIWKEDKLHHVIWRFITSWHAKKEETVKQRQKELLEELEKMKIINFLTSIDPKCTIPPYDDMNNRGAVKCHSLRLNINYLNKNLPNWRVIANKLARDEQKDKLVECTTSKSDNDLTLLHRVLDVSSNIDDYKLRDFKIENYIDILGKKDSEDFLKFTKHYYEVITKKVRTGIWQSTDDVFVLCNHNPPYKNNQIHTLLSGVLGFEISLDDFKRFEKELWTKKNGKSSLLSYCKNIEGIRKKKGNGFKLYIEELYNSKELDKDQKKDLSNLKMEKLDFWVKEIAEFFNINESLKTRFRNHFSMSQLYTIVATKREGFMSTCKWCSAENSFRTRTNLERFVICSKETGEVINDVEFDDSKHIKAYENSNAQRLPADTQRPFSGKIERYIDKLGYEIAKIKANEFKDISDSNISLKIVLEQNSFRYEESLIDSKIKNAKKKAKDLLLKNIEYYDKSIENKENRIKAFNNSICLYCNQEILSDGEIDHILPRSYTLSKYGAVFNGEGNLLYVHKKCNQAKKNSIKKLDDLKTHTSIDADSIQKEVMSIKSYRNFSLLTASQQKAFRLALFLPNNNEAYIKVLSFLRTEQSTRVNGTQKYLAKKIQEKLIKMFPNKEFEFEFILVSSEDISRLRKEYSKEFPILAKPKDSKQSPSSHTIDAIFAFSGALKKITGDDNMLTGDEILKYIQINNIETKPLSKIQKEKKGNLGNSSIFNDGIYQERFTPIYKYENKYFTGFVKAGKILDFSNCVEIKTSDFEAIKDYLKNELIKDKGLIVYEINKQKVLDLFHNVSNGLSSDLKLAQILDKFSYNLKKKSVLYAPKILKNDKETSIKVYGKTIVLPTRKEWEAFDKFFKNELKKQNIEYKEKKGEEYQIDDNIFIDICKIYFNIQKNKDFRNKARKVFSLPVVNSPSGGVRIKRKNHKNEAVYQMMSINGAKSIGFALENGKVNTSKDVLLPTLVKSKRVSLKEIGKKELLEYIDMDCFRDVSSFVNLKDISIYVAPASSSRPQVKAELSFDILKNILMNDSINFIELDNLTLTIEQKAIFDEVFLNCGFSPRDNKIKILKADSNRVLMEFSNNNKTIMKYYDEAQNISL